MSLMAQITDALIKGKAKDTRACVDEALRHELAPAAILNDGLLAGMHVIGERFKHNEVFVPEVLMAARAMKAGMEALKPLLAEAGVQPKGTIVMGTVKGDLHDIGKNLVCMMLEGAGFKVIDAGINVTAKQMVALARDNQATLIGASALLTTTMVNMQDVVEAIKSAGLQSQIKLMIGGAPVTQAFADEIGADGYAPDAATATDLARQLVGVS